MTDTSGSLSAIGRNLRSLARQAHGQPVEAAKRIMFLDQSIDGALDLLLEQYERAPSRYLLEVIGDFYAISGNLVAAQSVFKSLYYEKADLHVTNLIYAGLPATRALVDDKKKLLYIPIPKCGSSSVKNYFTAAIHGKTYGETVHFQHADLYRTVSADEIETRYGDYFRFALVRDPIKRLVSYYIRNVVGGSLRREAQHQAEFLKMPTRPGPRQFAFGFHQYRQMFKDFRHHTDPICGYLDPFQGKLDRIYTMAEIGELREKLSEIYECNLEDDRSMVSKDDPKLKADCTEAL
ncbi:MAG: sulfotransferase family 2 domain-containing protein, partial [Rhodobacteraceae bacterium]|nr:sulfotransferase family 2 domain-containing protein [Paracoccaceae bacterium]